jgi:CRISPR-associated protein Csy1
MSNALSERALTLRNFLDECVRCRREFLLKKQEGKKDAKKRKDIEKMERALILSDGAQVASKVQMATHIAKATCPDAHVRDVTNLLCVDGLPQHRELGTHSLCASDIVVDATYDGKVNKKAYEAYLLLCNEFRGKTILQMLKEGDADAIAALDDNANVAQELADQLVKIDMPKRLSPASHSLMKQVYWLAGENATCDSDYHLLSPLFATSLAHVVHKEISDACFGKANDAARSHWNKGEKPQESMVYRDYPNLGVRNLGGENTQNISQLNSERNGFNYLLASLPPHWQEQPESFLNIVSVFRRFRHHDNVSYLIKILCHLLEKHPKRTTRILRRQKRIEHALWWKLANFGLEIQEQHSPGWTRDENCKLRRCEQLWLDPGRAYLPAHPDHEEADRDFAQEFERKDWLGEIADTSARWLDEILRKKANFLVEQIEFQHWKKQAKRAIVEVSDRPATLRHRARLAHISGESDHG